jgi:hypothetical protein
MLPFRERGSGLPVQAATYALDLATLNQPSKLRPRDAGALQVPGGGDADPPQQLLDLVRKCRDKSSACVIRGRDVVTVGASLVKP